MYDLDLPTAPHAGDAPEVIDGSAPLWVRRRFLQRSRHKRFPWIVSALVALVVIWVLAAAVLGIRP